jgi:uncharacterized membrane protein YheB (UPF0754 family)
MIKFIIGSLVGAIIGYITNWLAIKMLFKPHNEVRIGRFKVPFTPGLIPKEKSRIAKSVGESIGQHLLTKETIMKSLCSENMNGQVDVWVQSKFVDMQNSQVTVENEMKDLLGGEYSNFISNTKSNISNLLVDYINEEDVKRKIVSYATAQIVMELRIKPQAICKGELYNSIKRSVLNGAIKYKNSENFYEEIQNVLEEKVNELKNLDKNFNEVIPMVMVNSLKVHIYEKKYEIAMAIKKMMKEEKNKQKIRLIVGETISTKLSPMIAMFMNADSINEKVVTGINEFLDEEKNHNDIAAIISDVVDKLLEKSVSIAFSELSSEETSSAIKLLTNVFTTQVVDENLIRNIFLTLEDKFSNFTSIEEMLEKTSIDYRSAIENFISNRIDAMSKSDSVKVKITEVTSEMINRTLKIEMKSLFKEDGKRVSNSISKVVRELYNKFVENKASDVIEILDVAKIVEDKINEFDVAFTEEIILEIASKELRAITWLGALLGAIMGILAPLLGSL